MLLFCEGTSGDDPTTASPTNFIQNVGQNIGQNIGQLWSNMVGGGSSSTTGKIVLLKIAEEGICPSRL